MGECVSLPSEAPALSPGLEMPDEEDVAEWPAGRGCGQSEGPGHPALRAVSCAQVVSPALDPTLPAADPTAAWESDTSCPCLALSLAQPPP